jgi:hypothetical protein
MYAVKRASKCPIISNSSADTCGRVLEPEYEVL